MNFSPVIYQMPEKYLSCDESEIAVEIDRYDEEQEELECHM